MKRYGNLYYKVTDIDNIKEAIIKASKGKRDRYQVVRILNDINKYALKIQSMLINHTYIPSPYKVAEIYDGARKKVRVIKKPKFYPDQCIHWSLMLIVEPLFEKRFYKWSCSSIKGRGCHYAKNYVKGALKDNKYTKYAYQLDIKKFYPSIDNELLKKKLRTMFKDKELLWLFDTIIDSDKGLPIGNYTSQWLANFYLTDLDFYIKQDLKVPYYVRYADDMLLFESNKRRLQKDRRLIESYIDNNKLKIKKNWQVYLVNSRPIDFLGFKFYRDHIVLRDSLCLRIQRRSKKIYKKNSLISKDAKAIVSYWGYIKASDSYNFYCTKVRPYCDFNKCKEVISNEAKKQCSNQIQI